MLAQVLIALAGSAALAGSFVTVTLACSPPFEKPTIRALGPAPVVLIGTIGERVAGGRQFHVERSWNGPKVSPIVIAFKEGEPIGDCSYPVSTGQALIIAPYGQLDGGLSADLSTLQADPSSDDGRRYIAEAEALFGAGVIPVAATAPPATTVDGDPVAGIDVVPFAVALVAALGLFGIVILVARRRRIDEPGT